MLSLQKEKDVFILIVKYFPQFISFEHIFFSPVEDKADTSDIKVN